jgi:hypothetical protein
MKRIFKLYWRTWARWSSNHTREDPVSVLSILVMAGRIGVTSGCTPAEEHH